MKIAPGFLLAVSMLAQNATDTPDAHVAIAKAAAGDDYQNLFNFVCAPPAAPRGGGGGGGGGVGATAPRGQGAGQPPAGGQGAAVAAPRGGGGGGQRGGTPDRATWHAEPVKVFDNLYWFGQTEYSVWALTTSDGIIVFDAINNYRTRERVVLILFQVPYIDDAARTIPGKTFQNFSLLWFQTGATNELPVRNVGSVCFFGELKLPENGLYRLVAVVQNFCLVGIAFARFLVPGFICRLLQVFAPLFKRVRAWVMDTCIA